MYSRLLRSAAALACAAALSGCASNVNPVTGKSIYLPISPAREEQYGIQGNASVVAKDGVYGENAALTAYVDRVGQAVAKGVVRKSVHYKFIILDADDINAHSLPGGYVYVTRGALSFANSEAELASILGHEIGHIDAYHFSSPKRDTLGTLRSVLLRNSSAGADDIKAAEKYAADSAQAMIHSLEQEYEADALGIHYIAAAGYDPQAAVRMIATDAAKTRLDGNEIMQEVSGMGQVYPTAPDRVKRAAQAAKNQAVNPTAANPATPDPAADHAAYLAAIDGMMFGADPADGVVEGRRLIRPDLGFSFSAPPNFDLRNQHSVAIGFSHTAYMYLEMGKSAPTGTLTDYVTHGFMKGATVENVRATDANGFEAVTGTVNQKLFTLRIAAIHDQAGHLYRLSFLAPTKVFRDLDKSFMDSIESFRPAAAAEIPTPPKMRLHVVTVGAGDTVESLAARMAEKEKKVEWFRLLNGLGETDGVQAGQKVKVVVVE